MATTPESFRSRYGPWALVAGSSIGLGAEFARQLAEKGLHLVLVARRPAPLEDLARRLGAEYAVETRSAAVDLASPELVQILHEKTRDVEIGLLVYNAALSRINPFFEEDLAEKLTAIDVNCRAPLILTHHFGKAMIARGGGGIILMSSVAGFQGAPLVATYAATKAYNLVLAEGLWYELREHGVDMLAFCAGATRTPSYEESQPRNLGIVSAPVMEVGPVVSQALAALGTRPTAIAGRANRLAQFVMSRLLPRRLAIQTMGKTMRAMYPR